MLSKDVSSDNPAGIENSGSDHNTVAGSLIGAGRAFKNVRGHIYGKTDLSAFSETVGNAHWKFEDRTDKPLKFVGLPFDFDTQGKPFGSLSLPETYRHGDYLHYKNVMGSVLRGHFGVQEIEAFSDGTQPRMIEAIARG